MTSVTPLDPAGRRIADPQEPDALERGAQRTMAFALARHNAKPGRDWFRAGLIVALCSDPDHRDEAWFRTNRG